MSVKPKRGMILIASLKGVTFKLVNKRSRRKEFDVKNDLLRA